MIAFGDAVGRRVCLRATWVWDADADGLAVYVAGGAFAEAGCLRGECGGGGFCGGGLGEGEAEEPGEDDCGSHFGMYGKVNPSASGVY